MLKASSFGMEIFLGVPSLSRLISKNCMNGVLSNLSDRSYPGILHANTNGRSLEGRMAQRARGSVAPWGIRITRRSLGAAHPRCEGDPGFLPPGVSLILTFRAGFGASIGQASAEPL